MVLLPLLPYLSTAILYDVHRLENESSVNESRGNEWRVNESRPEANYSGHPPIRIAWLHVMKTGSSFATMLAHLANTSLPHDAHIENGTNLVDPEDKVNEDGRDSQPIQRFFRTTYPVDRWFQGVFRNPENPGAYSPILPEEFDDRSLHWVGFFRQPVGRVRAAWYEFGHGKVELSTFAERVQGQQANMLSLGEKAWPKIKNEVEGGVSSSAAEEPNVTLALERLDKFAFVGLYEEYDLSVCLFHKVFGNECLRAEFLDSPSSKYAPVAQTERDELKILEKIPDSWDTSVYNRASQRFWSDVRKYNVSIDDCRQACNDVTVKQDVSH
eukprot:TRINITY_DN1419_c0_g1_i1.p1 TRINITY_DN1419_c0_g1~~TRINITY_DN1419_c0_g1_i1.p1  ORF type:complete len:327 (-),score=47.70 TRINITY_DN1419_c0_g1_i1:55-1035(-)